MLAVMSWAALHVLCRKWCCDLWGVLREGGGHSDTPGWLANSNVASSQGKAIQSWDTSYRLTGMSPELVCMSELGGLFVCPSIYCEPQCWERQSLWSQSAFIRWNDQQIKSGCLWCPLFNSFLHSKCCDGNNNPPIVLDTCFLTRPGPPCGIGPQHRHGLHPPWTLVFNYLLLLIIFGRRRSPELNSQLSASQLVRRRRKWLSVSGNNRK